MNKKPIFDEVRRILGRSFSQAEVVRIDRAIELAVSAATKTAASAHRLGALSEQFESGGRGPGAVSSGRDDPGGVSYGIHQLSSRTGTVAVFMKNEGAGWQREFGSAVPGSAAFSAVWRAVAEREPDAFMHAQHAFIERTHYRPAVKEAFVQTGMDLDSRHDAVRDAAWSVAVQHGGAARILAAAIAITDNAMSRENADYDRRLIEAIYAERTRYVLRVAGRSGASARRTLASITRNRYPAELKAALAMFGETSIAA